MNLKYRLLLMQMRPRVVHRLAGRMRIHIPALKKVNGNFHEIATVLLNGFQLPENVSEVKVNYITGNILVLFQYKKISEGQILDWIFDIRHIVESIFIKFIHLDDDEIKIVQIKLLNHLEHASALGLRIDKMFRIPDEIWN